MSWSLVGKKVPLGDKEHNFWSLQMQMQKKALHLQKTSCFITFCFYFVNFFPCNGGRNARRSMILWQSWLSTTPKWRTVCRACWAAPASTTATSGRNLATSTPPQSPARAPLTKPKLAVPTESHGCEPLDWLTVEAANLERVLKSHFLSFSFSVHIYHFVL